MLTSKARQAMAQNEKRVSTSPEKEKMIIIIMLIVPKTY
jgi:hypothetical protein